MCAAENDSEREAQVGKRFSRLLKTMEVYSETRSIEDTARVLGITQKTVERRLSAVGKEFEAARGWLKEIEKYKKVLFRKETAHSKRIGILCRIGKMLGYRTRIGDNEQSYLCYIDGQERVLSDLSDFRRPKFLGIDSRVWGFLRFIDVIWIKELKVHYAFEVETTTSFVKAFDRCSNILSEYNAMKVVVIPKERKNRLLASIQSVLIEHEISKGNWYLLDFRALDELFVSNKQTSEIVFRNTLESISP